MKRQRKKKRKRIILKENDKGYKMLRHCPDFPPCRCSARSPLPCLSPPRCRPAIPLASCLPLRGRCPRSGRRGPKTAQSPLPDEPPTPSVHFFPLPFSLFPPIRRPRPIRPSPRTRTRKRNRKRKRKPAKSETQSQKPGLRLPSGKSKKLQFRLPHANPKSEVRNCNSVCPSQNSNKIVTIYYKLEFRMPY